METSQLKTVPSVTLQDGVVFPLLNRRIIFADSEAIKAIKTAASSDKFLCLIYPKRPSTKSGHKADFNDWGTFVSVRHFSELGESKIELYLASISRVRIQKLETKNDLFFVTCEYSGSEDREISLRKPIGLDEFDKIFQLAKEVRGSFYDLGLAKAKEFDSMLSFTPGYVADWIAANISLCIPESVAKTEDFRTHSLKVLSEIEIAKRIELVREQYTLLQKTCRFRKNLSHSRPGHYIVTTDDPGVRQVTAEEYAEGFFNQPPSWLLEGFKYRLPPLAEVLAVLHARGRQVLKACRSLAVEFIGPESFRLTKSGEHGAIIWSFVFQSGEAAAAKAIEEDYLLDEEIRLQCLSYYVELGTFRECAHGRNVYDCPSCQSTLPDIKSM